VYEVATGKVRADRVTHVQNGTAGGSASWNKDGTGFYYTRYPRETERPKGRHRVLPAGLLPQAGRGPRTRNTYVLGKELPRIAEIVLFHQPRGGSVLVAVANGDAARSSTS